MLMELEPYIQEPNPNTINNQQITSYQMKKEMLINVLQSEECRIAIVEDGLLEELYVERSSQESYVGNIYKGRIVNIEPSIQAAFVDFGIGRNGFLHVSDVDPAYYKHLLSKEDLAEYEAELDREYGTANRGRDRNDRGPRDRGRRQPPPQPMTAWLEQQPPPAPPRDIPAEIVSLEDVEGFAEGLDEIPIAEEIIETLVEAEEELPVESPVVRDTRPETTPHVRDARAEIKVPDDTEQEFGAGLIEEGAVRNEEAFAPNVSPP